MLKKAKAKPKAAATMKKAAIGMDCPGVTRSAAVRLSQVSKKTRPGREVVIHEVQAPRVAPMAAALRAFNRVTETLGIVTEDKLKLLNLRKTKYFDYLKLPEPDLDLDTRDRLGYFLVIVELAGNLVGDAGEWLRSPNTAPLFGGKAPLDLLLVGRMEGMFTTLNYLKGSYGGWA